MNAYDFIIKASDGERASLSKYKGKVLLIVNTASKCGFTPQYKELETLYEKIGNNQFEILAFPCNQFGNQEPGTNEEVQSFCQLNYGVTFPVFAKIDVRNVDTHPLFTYLCEQTPFKGFNLMNSNEKVLYNVLQERFPDYLIGDSIKWNFTKFLIDKEGNVVSRFESPFDPLDILPEIEKLL